MRIDPERCRRCLECLPVCPVGAIRLQDKQVFIDQDACVECGVCARVGVCAEEALWREDPLPYPRIIRAAFSDPLHRHESTEVLGRGTEEMKTNDAKNEFTADVIGFSVEIGRPGVGACLSELDKVTRKVMELGGTFADYNPVRALMADGDTGALKPEVLSERVLSAIAEFTTPGERALDTLAALLDFIEAELETVATVSLIVRNQPDGTMPVFHDLAELGKRRGFSPYPNGKINLGLARPS
ncbi:MAG: 4Fe-4S binding protein [Proteobacteria bacterium]|nr:4Fe-4S binding protein [Pseudomonadota bacterium]